MVFFAPMMVMGHVIWGWWILWPYERWRSKSPLRLFQGGPRPTSWCRQTAPGYTTSVRQGPQGETPLGPLGQLILGIFRQQIQGANILVKWHGCISWMDMCQYLVLNKPDGRIKRDHIKLQPALGSMGFNAMWSTQCDNPPRLTGNGSYKPSKVWGRFCCCVYHRRF